MPTRNINLTPEMDKYVDSKINSGVYANASEVLRAGLRALEEDEKEDQVRLDALRAAIEAGEQSGPAEDGAVDRIYEYIRQMAAGERMDVA